MKKKLEGNEVNQKSQSSAAKALKKSSNSGMVTTVAAIVVTALVILGGVIWWTNKQNDVDAVELAQPADKQIEFAEDGSIFVGSKDAQVVEIYEDYMCPACASFEKQNGLVIADAVEKGQVRTHLRPLNFLNRQSKSGTYSTRAIAAVQCSAQFDSVKGFHAFTAKMFERAPQEGGRDDRTDEQLAALALDAKTTTETQDCIRDISSSGAMKRAEITATNQMKELKKKIGDNVSTPTVLFADEKVNFSSPSWVQEVADGRKPSEVAKEKAEAQAEAAKTGSGDSDKDVKESDKKTTDKKTTEKKAAEKKSAEKKDVKTSDKKSTKTSEKKPVKKDDAGE